MELLLLSLFCTAAAALEVKMSPSPIIGLVYEEVELHCNFTVQESVRKEDVAVKWSMKTPAGDEKTVFQFDGNHTVHYRPGPLVNTELLPYGIASLTLSDVMSQDEGIYTCTVLVTPQYGQGKIQLKVRAQPQVLLSPQSLVVAAEREKTFSCEVHSFYPPAINISWLVRKQDAIQEAPLSSDICTGVPSRGANGLFAVLSHLTQTMNETSNGSMYICEVHHESLEKSLRRNTTLLVSKLKVYHEDTAFIIGVAFACIIVTSLCTVFLTISYQARLGKAEPQVSSIIKPDVIPINEKIRLICNINGFRPKRIQVKWYRKTPGMIASAAQYTGEDAALSEGREDVTNLAKQPLEISGRFYTISSCLSYTPTIRDDKAEFECRIHHQTLKNPIQRTTVINVTARPTSFYIFSSPQAPVEGEKFILICVVEKFYPRDIDLFWFRNGRPVEEVTQFGPFRCESDFYSVWSQIEFTLTKDEKGAIYTCQVEHSSFGKVEELSYEINLQGTPPEVLWVTADPLVPVAGEELRLNCRINNFSPNLINVNWFQDGKPLKTGICHSVCVVGANGLHSMWSLLRVTPKQGEGKTVFTCKVEHGALKECIERRYTLAMPVEED